MSTVAPLSAIAGDVEDLLLRLAGRVDPALHDLHALQRRAGHAGRAGVLEREHARSAGCRCRAPARSRRPSARRPRSRARRSRDRRSAARLRGRRRSAAIGRVPLVPYTSRRRMAAKSASREFSSAHTTARPPGLASMPAGGHPLHHDRPASRGRAVPRCPRRRSRPPRVLPGVALCVSVLPIEAEPERVDADALLLERAPASRTLRTKLSGGKVWFGIGDRREELQAVQLLEAAQLVGASPTPGRHSESPLCWFISTSGSIAARDAASAARERAAVGVRRVRT